MSARLERERMEKYAVADTDGTENRKKKARVMASN